MAVAIHNYHDAEGKLPPAALRGKQGEPLLSWRVLLLPYLGQGDLHHEFHLDEPWDSEHNIQLLPRMPRVSAPFSGKATPAPYTTYYQVIVGPGTAFEEVRGLRFPDDFPDGTSGTLLIVEANEAVPWTKPQDLVYEPGGPLPQMGGVWPDRIQATMVDGWLRSFMKKTVTEQTLKAAITRNGKDGFGPDWQP